MKTLTLIVALAILPATACNRHKNDEAAATPAELRISGLELTGDGSVLSWKPFANAASYAVIVAGEKGTDGIWIWTGDSTHVPYGTTQFRGIEEAGEYIPILMPPQRVRALQPGGHYRWIVLAFDKKGVAAGVSDVAHFSVAGAPAKTPQRTEPAQEPTRAVQISQQQPTLLNACDVITAAEVSAILGHAAKSATRTGPACDFGSEVRLVVGPAMSYELGRQMLKGMELQPLSGLGDQAYWVDVYGSVQVSAVTADRTASVTISQPDVSTQKQLELAKRLANALLQGRAASAP